MKPKEWSLALSLVPGVGGTLYKRLTGSLGSPQAVLESSPENLKGLPRIGPKITDDILSSSWQKRTEKVLQVMRAKDIQYVTIEEEEYPQRLTKLPSPPPVLFFKGNLKVLNALTLTIVGTRNASRYGMDMAFSLASDLASAGLTIISGMARGIDTAAHRGALESGITAAVVGSGLDVTYPPENTSLSIEIVEKGGAVASPFPPETPPERGNFPRRNLVMAALTDGVLVIEAGKKSGAIMTAHYARKMGKIIFALPGTVGSSKTKGVHTLIKEGAHLIEEASDILHFLSLGIETEKRVKKREPSMDEKEEKIWNALEEGPLPIEVLMEKCSVTLQEIYSLLLQMELKGLVTSQAGNIYERRMR